MFSSFVVHCGLVLIGNCLVVPALLSLVLNDCWSIGCDFWQI